MNSILSHCLTPGVPSAERARLLTAVEEAVRSRKIGPPGSVDSLNSLVTHADRPAARSAMRLVGLWKVKELRPAVEAVAKTKTDANTADVSAAIEAVALFADRPAVDLMLALAVPDDYPKSNGLRLHWIALAKLDTPTAASVAVGFVHVITDAKVLTDIFTAFLAQRGGAQILAKPWPARRSRKTWPRSACGQYGPSAQNVPDLVAAITKAGRLAEATPYPNEKTVKTLTGEVTQFGDAARGELVFRKKDNQCFNCHAIGGAGGRVGPDLTSIGASAQIDYLVESIT